MKNDAKDNAKNGENPLIRLRGVSKVYLSDGGEFQALKKIDLDVKAGDFLGILGKSGAGKTTLLNMISGVDTVTEGFISVDGQEIRHWNETRKAKWRGHTLGVIHQSFQLLSSLPLMDNVLLPVDFCGDYRPLESARLGYGLLTQMGLAEHAEKTPLQTSGGQQQRIAIARALANDPPILLADEPTGSLDSATAAVIMEIFQELICKGKTILMATHDSSIASAFSRTVTLSDGELVAGLDRPTLQVELYKYC